MTKGLGRIAGTSFLLRLVAAGMTYIFVVAMARMMSIADFGVVGTLMSGALLFSVIGCVGQRMALLRFVPPLIEINAPTEPIVNRAMRLALTGNFIVFLILALSVYSAQLLGIIDNAKWIIFGCLVIPLTGVIDMQSHLARAYKSIVIAIAPKDILWRLISLLAIGSIFWVTEKQVDLPVTLVTLVSVLVILIAIQSALMSRFIGTFGLLQAIKRPVHFDDTSDWRASVKPLWISSVGAIVFTNIDVVFAGILIGPEAAAIYFSANRLALVPSIFLTSYNIVVGPLFSRHFSSGRKDEMRRIANSATLQVFIPTLAVITPLYVFSDTMLTMFGTEFSQGSEVLRWLLLAALLNAALGPNDLILNMCGQEGSAMKSAIIGLCIGGALIFLGAVSQNIVVLSASTFASVLLQRIVSWAFVRLHFGFSADIISALRLTFKKGSFHGRTD